MRLPLSCSSLLVLLSFLCFPIIAQAGDFWSEAESQLKSKDPNLSHCHCQFLEPFSLVDAGRQSSPQATGHDLVLLIREFDAAPRWDFQYQPKTSIPVTGLKPQVRPALLRQVTSRLQRTVCSQAAMIPGGLERQLAVGIVEASKPVERMNFLIVGLQSELAAQFENLKAIDLVGATQAKAESIALPAAWEKDSYWRFFSDCDRWDVCLRELELQQPAAAEFATAEQFESLIAMIKSLFPHSFTQRIASFSGTSRSSMPDKRADQY